MSPFSSAGEDARQHYSLFLMQKGGEKTLKSKFFQPFNLPVTCRGLKRTKEQELQE